MRRWTGTLVLLALAAGMGAYIVLVERKGPSTGELRERDKRIVAGFDRGGVRRITVERERETVVLSKDKDQWRIEKPVPFPADGGAVESLLSAVEFLELQRRIEGKPAQYGLDRPRARLVMEGGAGVRLEVGGDDATGRSVYVGRQGEMFVVERNFLETLQKPLHELRDRRVLPFDREKLRSIAVVRDGRRTVIERSGPRWLLASEGRMLASTERVEGLLAKLEGLKATRVVAEGLADLAKHGLEGAPRSIEVDTGSLETLLLGGRCVEQAGEVVAARKGGASAILCLKEEETDGLLPDPMLLRESRLLPVRADEVRRIAIEAGGKKIVLERADEKWAVTDPASQPADADVVKKWIEDLGAFRATETVALDAKSQGLTKPARVVVEADGRKLALAFGSTQGGTRWVRRDDEPVAMKVHAEVSQNLSATPLAFRVRRLLEFSRYDVKRIAASGTVEEEAEKSESGGWRLKKPGNLPGDDSVIDEVAGALAELKAEKFVADAAAPAHGLSPPARTLTATVEPPPGLEDDEEDEKEKKADKQKKVHTVEIGRALADKSCYGRLEGKGAVFVLAEATCKSLRSPLVTRKLFDLEEDKIVGFVLRRGAEEIVLEKRGPEWHRAGGGKVDPAKIEDLLGAIRNARAKDALGYGQAAITQPRLALTVRTDGKPDQTLQAGGPAADGLEARIAGRDVRYTVDAGVIESLERLAF